MPLNIPPPPARDVSTSSGKSVSDSQFFSRNGVLKSEVQWTFKTISSHVKQSKWTFTFVSGRVKKLSHVTLVHATANDMVQHFEESVVNSDLPICNLEQISMDGPNVNWKFFTDMSYNLSKNVLTNVHIQGKTKIKVSLDITVLYKKLL